MLLLLAALHVFVASDPLPFALHGFSAHVGAAGESASFEAAVFQARAGDTLLKVVEPSDAGFTATLDGLSLEGYWHAVRWSRGALLVGAQVHLEHWEVQHESTAGSATFHQIYLLPTVALRWFPFEGPGLFLKPLLSAGPALLAGTPQQLGTHVFTQLPVFPLATVLVGWQF